MCFDHLCETFFDFLLLKELNNYRFLIESTDPLYKPTGLTKSSSFKDLLSSVIALIYFLSFSGALACFSLKLLISIDYINFRTDV